MARFPGKSLREKERQHIRIESKSKTNRQYRRLHGGTDSGSHCHFPTKSGPCEKSHGHSFGHSIHGPYAKDHEYRRVR